MPTLSNIIKRHARIDAAGREWLRRLTTDWQIISDLAFADLVLWLDNEEGDWVAAAQCRPGSGPTIYYTDIVGTVATAGRAASFDAACEAGTIKGGRDSRWGEDVDITEEIIPVVLRGQVLGILTRQVSATITRTPSRLELNYVDIADEMIGMVARGEFPSPSAPTSQPRHSPRVGDGLARLNAEGEVLYASPNALSVVHRLGLFGDMTGASLVDLLAEQLDDLGKKAESLRTVLLGRAPWSTELDLGGASVALRSIPLTERGIRSGALLLLRDVTDLRRRELELMTKDATIREIHHRVKNNLQTVAALLRLQGRRAKAPEARIALAEAQRRVATIATVHDLLSQTLDETVDFDEVFGRNLRLAADAASAGISVRTIRDGSFGRVTAEAATVLALVLTELVTNAVEHGLAPNGGGTVWITAQRDGNYLTATIADDGVGINGPGPLEAAGLGTQIVRAFVTGQLGGSIDWLPRPGGGTQAVVEADLS